MSAPSSSAAFAPARMAGRAAAAVASRARAAGGPLRFLDSLLDRVTSYRLVLLYLLGLLAVAVAFAAAGLVPASPLAIIGTTIVIAAAALAVNQGLARLLSVPASIESPLITALILALIAGPVSILQSPGRAALLALAGALAAASKFLIAPRKQHIFNPAALGIFLTGLLFHEYSTWWVGNVALLAPVALGGLLVLRKIGRLRIVGLFVAAFTAFLLGFSLLQGLGLLDAASGVLFVFLHTEVVFFAVVMLTEPVTSPKTQGLQAIHVAIVAFFLLPQLSIAGVTFSPEAALLIGNLFAFAVGRSARYVLPLKARRRIGRGIYSFAFDRPPGLDHRVGQYMEWILPMKKSDSRGNRRYLTVSSSPAESELSFAVRVPERPSAYKRALMALEPGDRVVAAELAGDFVLPARISTPVTLIAGGIGITPFRAMVSSLLERGEPLPVTLLYSNYTADEIVFRDLFDRAERELGLKVVYTLTDPARVPRDWTGQVGLIDAAMIAEEVPDYSRSLFYVSGPLAMVQAVKASLRSLLVRRRMVRTDFFPGYTA